MQAPSDVVQVTTTVVGSLFAGVKIKLIINWFGGSGASTTKVLPLPANYMTNTPMVISEMVPSSILTTGRHYYELQAFLLDQYDQVVTWVDNSGVLYLVNPADVTNGQAYGGSGWTFGSMDRLLSVPASNGYPDGFLLWAGTGSYRFYADQSNGTYLNNGPDFGKIVAITGGYKYVTVQGVTEVFDSNGYETNWVSADGAKTVTFTYDGSNLLQNMNWYDGSTSTFSYTSGELSQVVVQMPAATDSGLGNTTTGALATYSLSYSSGQVSSIQQPDGRTRYYTYDGSGRLVESRIGTSASSGLNVNSYRYDSNGFLSQIRAGNFDSDTTGLNVYSITPYNTAGLASIWYPLPVVGVITDPLNRTTSYSFDQNGFVTRQENPDGGVYTYARDAVRSRLLTETIPGPSGPLTTTYAYDLLLSGVELNASYPDGTTEAFTWNNITATNGVFGIDRVVLASYTNDIGSLTTFAFDAVGHVAGSTVDVGGIAAISTYLVQSRLKRG